MVDLPIQTENVMTLTSTSWSLFLCIYSIDSSLQLSFPLENLSIKMAKSTKNVRVPGNYWTCYVASLCKTITKMEITQHAKYLCTFCGKDNMKRQAVGIWCCSTKNGPVKVARGAWTYLTTAAASVWSPIRRLKELRT